jgi:hypothetical protein
MEDHDRRRRPAREWSSEAAAAGLQAEQHKQQQEENPLKAMILNEAVKPRCVHCRFFVSNYARASGQCRYNPPVVVPVRGVMARFWPEVAETEWCGKFKWRKRPAANSSEAARKRIRQPTTESPSEAARSRGEET